MDFKYLKKKSILRNHRAFVKTFTYRSDTPYWKFIKLNIFYIGDNNNIKKIN